MLLELCLKKTRNKRHILLSSVCPGNIEFTLRLRVLFCVSCQIIVNTLQLSPSRASMHDFCVSSEMGGVHRSGSSIFFFFSSLKRVSVALHHAAEEFSRGP